MSIKPEYFTLSQLLNNRLFKIPNYQRAYSWMRKQRQDLFWDIDKLYSCGDNTRHHFMATIVCLDTNSKEEVGTDELANLDVVDGQQRLTTLIILLKALCNALDQGDEVDKKEASELQKLLVKDDQRLILLQTNHDSSGMFRNYLVHGQVPNSNDIHTLAEKNLLSAMTDCERYVGNWSKESKLIELLKLLKNRLDFIFYVLQDEGAVYTVFEVLNSRGLSVDWLDKCKSILMGIVYEKAKAAAKDLAGEIHKDWTQIYHVIGLRNVPGDDIVKYAATLWNTDERRKVLSAEDAVEFFREQCSNDHTKVIDVSSRLLKVTRKLADLYDNRRIEAVTEISHARLLAVSIMVADHWSEEERRRVLEQWERVTFRIFGLFGKDARSCVGEYTSLAHRILAQSLSKQATLLEIRKIGTYFPIDGAIAEFKSWPSHYNGWTHELRYFFYRYEEYLASKANSRINDAVWQVIWDNSPDHSIEHVLPQEYSRNWMQFPNAEASVDHLGNLGILTPQDNSRAGHKNFQAKSGIYQESNLRLMKEIAANDNWNAETIQERGEKLLLWAKAQWDDLRD